MRRILVAILLLLYTGLFAVGLPLNLHYCGGSFSGIVLVDDEGNCCAEEEKATDGCCETKYAYLKAENNHDAGVQVQAPANLLQWLNNSFFISTASLFSPAKQATDTKSNIKESPPPVEAFILLRNLRI